MLAVKKQYCETRRLSSPTYIHAFKSNRKSIQIPCYFYENSPKDSQPVGGVFLRICRSCQPQYGIKQHFNKTPTIIPQIIWLNLHYHRSELLEGFFSSSGEELWPLSTNFFSSIIQYFPFLVPCSDPNDFRNIKVKYSEEKQLKPCSVCFAFLRTICIRKQSLVNIVSEYRGVARVLCMQKQRTSWGRTILFLVQEV